MNIQRQVMKCLAWEGSRVTSRGGSDHRGTAAEQARNVKAVYQEVVGLDT